MTDLSQTLEKIFPLHPNAELNIFRSGGGLRICNFKIDGTSIFYGEGPDLDTALQLLKEDILAGGLEYSTVYGIKVSHYLTGTKTCTSKLEELIVYGHNVKIYYREKYIFLEFEYHYRINNNTVGELVKQNQETIEWYSHGNKYVTTSIKNGYTTKILQRVTSEEYRYTSKQIFSGDNIKELFFKAEGFLTAIELLNDRI